VSVFADDFFYYLIPAENFIKTGTPSFDGVTATNGFQPLWFLVISALLLISGASNVTFFVLLTLTLVILAVASSVEMRRVCRALGSPPLLATAIALYWGANVGYFTSSGMETNLVVYLAALLMRRLLERPLAEQENSALLITGLLASLMVLARLDSGILLALMVLLSWSRPSKDFLRRLLILSMGAVLVPIYLVLNLYFFETLLPVSVLAKQLKTSMALTWQDFRLAFFGWPIPFGKSGFHLIFIHPYLAYPAICGGLIRCLSRGPARGVLPSAAMRPVILAALLTPLCFFGAQFLLSGWGMWRWYYYPFFIAGPVGFSLSMGLIRGWPRERYVEILVAAGLIAFSLGHMILSPPLRRENKLFQEAIEIAAFAKRHPGTYAMGDRAGILGYLIPWRLIQMEGLVMDRRFLERRQAQEDLVQVQRDYNVDYYISTVPRFAPLLLDRDGCLKVTEPRRSLTARHSARLSGRFCEAPVFSFETRRGSTRVWRVSQER